MHITPRSSAAISHSPTSWSRGPRSLRGSLECELPLPRQYGSREFVRPKISSTTKRTGAPAFAASKVSRNRSTSARNLDFPFNSESTIDNDAQTESARSEETVPAQARRQRQGPRSTPWRAKAYSCRTCSSRSRRRIANPRLTGYRFERKIPAAGAGVQDPKILCIESHLVDREFGKRVLWVLIGISCQCIQGLEFRPSFEPDTECSAMLNPPSSIDMHSCVPKSSARDGP